MSYDSRDDTVSHINTVRKLLSKVIDDLIRRSEVHDQSKLRTPEVEVFNEFTPKLAGSTYGSDEYGQFLKAMAPALEHHYAANDHHPEHFPIPVDSKVDRLNAAYNHIEFGPYYGTEMTDAALCIGDDLKSRQSRIRSMNLVQIVEMLCDWKAATLRHNDGDIRKSIEINQRRFGYSDEIKQILLNTLPLIESEPIKVSTGDIAMRCVVGDRIYIDCMDGFSGPATVIAVRPVPGTRCRVQMDDSNPKNPFWAHDFEVSEIKIDE